MYVIVIPVELIYLFIYNWLIDLSIEGVRSLGVVVGIAKIMKNKSSHNHVSCSWFISTLLVNFVTEIGHKTK